MANFSKVYSAELDGINAQLIEVEVDLNIGLHSFNIVGLADKALNEAKERVGSAIKNTGLKPPNKENRKITVNLAPADIKKNGSQYDLAIAIGYLLASGQLKNFETKNKIFVGELALNGDVRAISGILNFALLAKKSGAAEIFIPIENKDEASLIAGIKIVPIRNLAELINHLEGKIALKGEPTKEFQPVLKYKIDISEIRGQKAAKRALTIAAAGGHNILMSGPPGSGKTMLAEALNSILPPLSLEESIEVSQIWSAAGLTKGQYIKERPFRSPHQSASPISVVGGGQNPRPGEISLAHRGVLFLDELPEFRRDLLEGLRQPLESGEISISRIRGNLKFPARFILVAAMNPCPCGFYGDGEKECKCSAYEVFRYQKKISGPLLDRMDLQINIGRVKIETLKEEAEDSNFIKAQVNRARGIQMKRFEESKAKIHTNSEMNSKDCENMIKLESKAEDQLKKIAENALISMRGYYRILKTAQTIADLAESELVTSGHILEAFQLRIRQE